MGQGGKKNTDGVGRRVGIDKVKKKEGLWSLLDSPAYKVIAQSQIFLIGINVNANIFKQLSIFRKETYMEHRIRAAAIVVKDNRLLLVKHQHPVTGIAWWVPPGGGLSTGETLYDCAARETYEETGLTVELGQILYMREFIDLEFKKHNLKVFILAKSVKGTLTTKNLLPNDMDSYYIKAVKFLAPKEMLNLTVFPEILKDEFWNDLSSVQLVTRYIRQQSTYPAMSQF